MLTAEDLLKPDDLPIESVAVPEWGGSGKVFVRSLMADERDAMEEAWSKTKELRGGGMVGFRAFACAWLLCDEAGKPLFANPEAVYEQLGRKHSKALCRVFDAGSRLNGLTKADQEELAKN